MTVSRQGAASIFRTLMFQRPLAATVYNSLQVLTELVVENYAVIERVRVRFHSGLNLLTGETGSGKSLVVDALGLLLGGRASAEMVRTGESRARVAGIFDVHDHAGVRRLLDSAGIEIEDGEALIEREILASGKSRAFIGSRPVSAALLKDLAPLLADIHGQHDQQLLFIPEAQRDMLDVFAGNQDTLSRLADLYRGWKAAEQELSELERSEQEKLRLLDLWSFQRREIESAALKPEEDSALESERRVLQNVQRLQEAAEAAYLAAYDGPESALSLAHAAARKVDELRRIDPSLDGLREHLKTAEMSLEEASFGLRDYLSKLEANPARLEEIETVWKPSTASSESTAAPLWRSSSFLEEARGKIAAMENAGERMDQLRKERSRLAAEFEKLAAELTARRAAAARKLEKRVEAELAQLAMERTVFRVEIARGGMVGSGRGPSGVSGFAESWRGAARAGKGRVGRRDFAHRSGAEDVPGGAASRSVVRTLVFDEVDAGVGGARPRASGGG